MMGIVRLVLGLVFTAFVTAFAVMNRFEIDLVWSPVHDSVAFPFYAVFLVALLVGFLFGGVLVWINAGSVRKDRRLQRREIKLLEKEIEKLKQDKFSSAPVAPASDILPAVQIRQAS